MNVPSVVLVFAEPLLEPTDVLGPFQVQDLLVELLVLAGVVHVALVEVLELLEEEVELVVLDADVLEVDLDLLVLLGGFPGETHFLYFFLSSLRRLILFFLSMRFWSWLPMVFR